MLVAANEHLEVAGDAVCWGRRARIQNWIIALALPTDRQAAAIIQFWEYRSRTQHIAEPASRGLVRLQSVPALLMAVAKPKPRHDPKPVRVVVEQLGP